MKFNVKFDNISAKNLTSENIRKFLSKETDLSVKVVKEAISHAIKAFFEDRRTFEVRGMAHVTVVPSSVDKKVMENHRNMVAEKIRQRVASEERAREHELKEAAVKKMGRKQATVSEEA